MDLEEAIPVSGALFAAGNGSGTRHLFRINGSQLCKSAVNLPGLHMQPCQTRSPAHWHRSYCLDSQVEPGYGLPDLQINHLLRVQNQLK